MILTIIIEFTKKIIIWQLTTLVQADDDLTRTFSQTQVIQQTQPDGALSVVPEAT